jgi:hypothetical protein
VPKPQQSFQEVLAAAIADLVEHGYDSAERVERWMRELRLAAERSLISAASLEQQLRDGLAAIYRKMVDRGGVIRYVPGVERFTLDKIKPQLRNELDRRILASANLIKLNRAQAIDKTLQRFQGWSTSIPPGGVSGESRREVKENVRKSLAQLPFEERRVLIDQGHKLTAAISEIVASDGGAIAGKWNSHYRQAGYDYREDHKERDYRENGGEPYLVRDSWAHRAGYVKKGRLGYYDEVTAVGQEPFCFPGDSRIPFADGVEKAYRRYFSGPLVILQTASGRKLRATPNHPILTVHGWLAIGTLNEGDYVIETAEQHFDAFEKNDDNAIPFISEIFSALQECGGVQSTRDGQLHQFHGDGSDGDVDIVDAARVLTFGRRPKHAFGIGRDGLESRKQFGFPMPAIVAAGVRAVELFLKRSLAAGAGLMRGLDQLAPAVFAFARHADHVGFRAVPQRYVEMMSQGAARDAQSFGQAQEAFPFKVRATRVVKVERRQWAGHVYNLQTESGWYIADGIIAHNCRCYITWLFNLRDLPDSMLTAKGKAALARVQGMEEVRSARTARADSAEVQIAQRDSLGPRAEAALATAERCDLMRYFDGLKRIAPVPGESEWHSEYDEERDQIVLHPSFEDLSETEKVETLLHEAGHRGEQIDPQSFGEFKTRHLDDLSSFESIANPVHLAEFKRTGKIDSGLASEVFAESYARAMLGLPVPSRLREFWDDRLGSVGDRFGQAEANYIATWPNRITRCQRCTMFLRVNAGTHGNGCTAVRGEISAHGHCRLFEIGQPEKVSRETSIPVPVDRDHDVQWMFVVSKNCDRLYADRTLPRTVTIKDKTFDPADLGWAHESGEWLLMMKMVKAFVEMYGRQPNEAERVAIYDHAHEHGGIPAEKKRAAELGVDFDAWEAWSRGELARLENRPIRRPPPDEHVEPTGHRRHELMEAVG